MSRKDRIFDLVSLGLLTLAAVAFTALSPDVDWLSAATWTAALFHLAVIWTLLWRRGRPVTVAVIVSAATAAITVSVYLAPGWLLDVSGRPDDVWISLATPIAAYSVVLYAAKPWQAWTIDLFLLVLLTRPWEGHAATIMGALLFVALPASIAARRRAQRRLIASLAERAEAAERERHLLAEAALAEERTRLAGEVHDVVSHRVVLMVLHAEALRRSTTDERTREAAAALTTAGREALGEMRELVGLLRGEPASGDEPPGLDELSLLAGESAGIGFPVEVVEEGERPEASPVIGRTVYRIVREALTNVRKHADGAETTVRVVYEGERVLLSVRNTAGSRAAGVLGASGSGSGLLGLRQRAELVGGTLRAGPVKGGGFLVQADLPAYLPGQSVNGSSR
ncbi:two-component sensor histidine kinase [Actinorhabdospora filicis]|uniref:histidine kinase n=1 Tax=Actinorhabdospora filicis TaxID=1785913 RepID=A0A9W6SFX9_9ACTN|nr:two-component sensor histidine kinase [Actinorhabdospora filicis]